MISVYIGQGNKFQRPGVSYRKQVCNIMVKNVNLHRLRTSNPPYTQTISHKFKPKIRVRNLLRFITYCISAMQYTISYSKLYKTVIWEF